MFRYPLGVEVVSTDATTDISKRGVAPGDIITSIDGTDITGMADLREALYAHSPGDVVKLGIFRKNSNQIGGKEYEISVELMEDTGTAQ
jgi:serine protease Do